MKKYNISCNAALAPHMHLRTCPTVWSQLHLPTFMPASPMVAMLSYYCSFADSAEPKNIQTPAKILTTTYMVVHIRKHVSRTTFRLPTHRHTDTLKTLPAFTILAGNEMTK